MCWKDCVCVDVGRLGGDLSTILIHILRKRTHILNTNVEKVESEHYCSEQRYYFWLISLSWSFIKIVFRIFSRLQFRAEAPVIRRDRGRQVTEDHEEHRPAEGCLYKSQMICLLNCAYNTMRNSAIPRDRFLPWNNRLSCFEYQNPD